MSCKSGCGSTNLSSCDCNGCGVKKYVIKGGKPSNLAIRACDQSPYFDRGDSYVFKAQNEPRNDFYGRDEVDPKYYKTLNPGAWSQNYDKSFRKVECKNNVEGCKEVYASTDPRLVSPAHNGQVLTLDRPPINGGVRLSNVYSTQFEGHGANYDTYSDINAGQITYYLDDNRNDAFHRPNFSSSSRMIGTLYKDPMGGMRPQYDRQPLICNPLQTKNTNYRGKLSWIQDSQDHREDLLARQMRTRNEQRWAPRWTGQIIG